MGVPRIRGIRVRARGDDVRRSGGRLTLEDLSVWGTPPASPRKGDADVWIRVLGSAAGGGFPQWNCDCPGCRAVRDGTRPCRPRTQSSVAVSADYRRWFVLNASPDIRAQIEPFPALHPHGVRDSPLDRKSTRLNSSHLGISYA